VWIPAPESEVLKALEDPRSRSHTILILVHEVLPLPDHDRFAEILVEEIAADRSSHPAIGRLLLRSKPRGKRLQARLLAAFEASDDYRQELYLFALALLPKPEGEVLQGLFEMSSLRTAGSDHMFAELGLWKMGLGTPNDVIEKANNGIRNEFRAPGKQSSGDLPGARVVLQALGKDATPAIPLLRARLRDRLVPTPWRAYLAQTLARIGGSEHLEEAVESFVDIVRIRRVIRPSRTRGQFEVLDRKPARRDYLYPGEAPWFLAEIGAPAREAGRRTTRG